MSIPEKVDHDNPCVTKSGLVLMQVCVPHGWTDEQAENFANSRNPTGIRSRWTVIKDGDESLKGDPERAKCKSRDGFVHIMLNC